MTDENDLKEIIQRFEDEVWFGSPSLQDKVLYPRVEAMSCFIFPIELLTLWQDSRINIIFKTRDQFFTLALDPFLPHFSMIYGNMPSEKIFSDIEHVIRNKEKYLNNLKSDQEVIAWFSRTHK